MITIGNSNWIGCGDGCLKCDSMDSGNFQYYSSPELKSFQFRICIACDWKNGYIMLAGGQCVKSNKKNCLISTNFLSTDITLF